ncbi:hypothetical protein AVEN_191713-1, partial [Araneus ventricosus]
MKVRTCQIWYL